MKRFKYIISVILLLILTFNSVGIYVYYHICHETGNFKMGLSGWIDCDDHYVRESLYESLKPGQSDIIFFNQISMTGNKLSFSNTPCCSDENKNLKSDIAFVLNKSDIHEDFLKDRSFNVVSFSDYSLSENNKIYIIQNIELINFPSSYLLKIKSNTTDEKSDITLAS